MTKIPRRGAIASHPTVTIATVGIGPLGVAPLGGKNINLRDLYRDREHNKR